MSGSTLQTGFSPVQFTLAPGNYLVGVGDYGGEFFSHWNDSTTNRLHPVTIASSGSVALTAVYSTTQGGGINGPAITVNSIYANGSAVSGLYVTLSQNGTTTASGFTPAAFSVTSGQTYSVTAEDYTNAYFSHWSNGAWTRSISITATNSDTPLTAVYTTSPPPPVGNSITVTSSLMNGTSVAGFFVDLRINGTHIESGYTPVTFSNLTSGVQYGVVIYWYGNYFFRHYSYGNSTPNNFFKQYSPEALNRYALVTLNGSTSVTLNGLYEYVPPSQAATLNILAEFPNGTIIGTSEVIGNYIYHQPGMWLTVAPPNSTTPFTGTFTGGSILPFVFFKNETYTVQMTLGYQNVVFSNWQDNNSTNPTRAITLYGNSQYVAIYNAT